MWIYFVVGILIFAVGFITGVYWSVYKFKEALDELVVESEEEKRHSDNEFVAVMEEYLNN